MIPRRSCALCIGLLWVLATTGVWAQESGFPVSPAQGRYPDAVTVRPADDTPVRYRFLHGDTPRTQFFLPLDDGLHLDAPPHTTATYRLEFRTDDPDDRGHVVTFVVDRLAPDQPRFEPIPGLHTSPITIRPLPDTMEAGDTMYYRVLDQPEATFRALPPEGVVLPGEAGGIRDYRVAAYLVDAVGNRSGVRTVRYRVDRSIEVPVPGRIILSPAPGTYANRQVVLVDTRGLRDVSATLTTGEANDADAGGGGGGGHSTTIDLSRPLLVPGAGRFSLEVSGTRVLGGEAVQRRVTWEQADGDTRLPEQGIHHEAVALSPPARALRVTFDDRPVTTGDPIWLETATLRPVPDEYRAVVLRFQGSDGGSADREWRVAYLMDGRRAPPVELERVGDDRAALFASSGVDIEWSPAAEDPAWQPVSGTVVSLESLRRGGDRIAARSRFPGGIWTRTLLTVPAPAPVPAAAPTLSVTGAEVTLETRPGTNRIVDALSGEELLEARGQDTPVRWRVPYGFVAEIRADAGTQTGNARTVDNAPPAPPEIRVAGDRLILSGSGQLFYRLDGAPDQAYTAPVELPGVAGAERSYRIEAYRISNGEVSPPVVRSHVVDRRRPVVATPPDGLLSNSARTTLHLDNPYDDMVFHYEVSATERPLIPRIDSAATDGDIVLDTPDGVVREYRISVRARFLGRDDWSPVERFTVTVDRVAPDAPALDATAIANGVVAFSDPRDATTEIWYRIGLNGVYRRYLAPVTVPAAMHAQPVVVDAYTRDAAGNRTPLSPSVTLPAADGPPVPPEIVVNGRPFNAPSITVPREPLVGIRAGGDDEIMWRERRPGDNSPPDFAPYTADRTLDSGSHVVEAYRRTADGARSDLTRLEITFDPTTPAAPDSPFVTYHADGRSGVATWSGAGADSLFVSIDTGTGEAQSFLPRQGTLDWQIPPDRDRVVVSYFFVDAAGTRSETGVQVIRARDTRATPVISGAADGAVYRQGRRVTLSGPGEIRFTLTTDGTPPPPVHALSRPYEEPLNLGAAVGEQRSYRLQARAFDGDRPISPPVEISFLVDRNPPPVPTIAGVRPGGYYATGQVASIEATSGSRVMYRLLAPGSGDSPFVEYTGQGIVLADRPSEPVTYRIEAYAVDAAGNRSQQLARWEITVDATSLHVDATAAAGGDGSRNAPFRSLEDALRTVASSPRRTVFLADGRYRVAATTWNAAVSAGGDLSILGGHDGGTWGSSGRPTALTVAGTDEIPLAPGMTLRQIRVNQPLSLTTRDDSPTVLLRDVFSDVSRGDAVTVNGGSLVLRSSSIVGAISARNGAHLQVEQSTIGAVSLQGARTSITRTGLTALHAVDGSEAILRAVRVEGNGTTGLGGLLSIDGGGLTVEESLVSDTGEDVLLIRGRDSDVRVVRSILTAHAERSALGLRVRGGGLSIDDSALHLNGGDYAYGLTVRDADSTLEGATIAASAGAESVGIVAGNSGISLRSSVVWLGSPAGGATTGVSAGGANPQLLELTDSLFLAGDATGSAVALRLAPAFSGRFNGNGFAGWRTGILTGTTDASAWGSQSRVDSAEDLNELGDGFGNVGTAQIPGNPPPEDTTLPEAGTVPAAVTAVRTAAQALFETP